MLENEGLEPADNTPAPTSTEGESPAPLPEPTMADVIQADLEGKPLQRGPDGKFLPRNGDAPNDPSKAVADPLKPPADPAKPDDPLAVPEGLSEGAQARFQKLATMVKERDEQLAEATESLQGLGRMFQESGVDEVVLNDLLAYSKVVTSGNVPQWETMLRNQVKNFETATGRAFQSADPFAEHQDIHQAVQGGQITPEHARELVAAREMQRRLLDQHQSQQTQRQTQQQRTQQVEQAIGQVTQMAGKWAQIDLDWPKKQGKIAEFAQKIANTPDISPSAYPMLVEQFYTSLVVAPENRPSPGPQPLRASGQSTGMAEPSSMLEAITRSLTA